MSQDIPPQAETVHIMIPVFQAIAGIAGILTGTYSIATSDVGRKYPLLVKIGVGATILGLGFLLYKEVLRETKPKEVKP